MARTRHDSAFQAISVSDRPVVLIFSTGLLIGAIALLPVAGWAQELPTGGTVAEGSVNIGARDGSSMTVTQNSDRAVVDWQSFSIGQGGHVGFSQPSSSSAILNRVTGSATSEIHGRMTANGQVFVVNPNGIFIGPNGQVTAGGGFVASTLDTRNEDFMAGRLRFEGLGNSAPVENAGRVTIGRGGYAALLGGQVSNSGVVTVPLGRIGLGAGEQATLDLSGDRFLQIGVPSESDDPGVRALIENSGKLSADGGQIEMRAATARNAARQAINLSGVAEARSVSVRNGAIVLGGGAGGSVKVTGRVTTKARQPVRRAPIQVETSLRPQLRPGGGEITITGRDIALAGATISADGADGGHVRIGGDYQGGGTLPTARSLSVDADTTITANAQGNGDGGRIILWSDLYTQFGGNIGARGGDTGGDGGFVEVSGKEVLAFSGLVDTRAPQGRSGTLLLDPVDVTIQEIDPTTPGYEDSDGNFGPDGTFTAGTSVINVNDLEVNLEMGDVVVSTGTTDDGRGGAGNITVDAPIDWLLASTLTLNSNNNIDVNQPVTSASGSLVLTAPGTISFFTGADVTVGSLSATATNLSVATADVVENGGGGTVAVQSFSLNGGSWTQTAPVLSAFSATNFEMSDSATFLRAAGGDGSVATPYRLTDIFGLQGVGSQSLLDQNFVIANTIDATGTANWTAGLSSPAGFKPIQGLGFTGFSGTLDGQGFAVDGLFIDTDQAESTLVDNAGLFGLTRGATVTDLALTNVDIQGGPQVGALAAEAINSTFDTITVTGRVGDAVADADYVGGIAGELQQSDLTNSSFTGTIDSDITSEIFQYIGGLAGYLFDGTISGGTFNGSIAANGGTSGTNERSIGGIVGSDLGLVSDSTATGTISVTGQGITQVGGLVGRGLSTDAISNSQAAVDIDVVMTGNELVSAGGLVGEASVSILDSSASGSVTVESGGAPVVGGLIGSLLNFAATEPISNVQASGDVTVTATGGAIEATQGRVGGLIGENIAPISQGQASGNVVVTSAVTPFDVGGFAGANVPATDSSGRIGSITESFATGSVTATLSVDDDNSVGGFVGGNEGSISDSYAEGAVDLTEGGFASEFGGADAYVGGFAGYNIAQIVRTAARGPVDAVGDFFTLLVGGHTGANLDGAITDSYAAGPSVNAVSNTQLSAGGLVGATSGGTITNGFASTAVTFGGSGTSASGGLIGLNFDFDGLTSGPTTPVTGGFWDLDTTGQPDDGAPGDYGTGLTLGEIQDTDGFLATAGAAGWDFETVWAPGDAGNLPALYTIDPVVFARPDPVTLTYGTAETTPITGSVFGGPAFYVFDTPGDTLDTSTAFDAPVFSDNTVGTQSVSISPGPFTSALGQDYRAVSSTAEAEITPAPLTVTPDDQTKDYGQTLTFDGTEFTASGLQYADTVDTVTLSSTGAVDTAGVALSPYDILASNALGTGLGNYDITYDSGSLEVQPIPGTITIEDQSKQYGTAFSFAGTEFTTSGFLFSDAVTQMDLASAGAAADAPVAGSPYAITGTVADGTGLANYVLTVQDGSLEVTPAPLTITPDDQSKTYGELFAFDGTEFVATGLLFSDAVTSLSLTSAGAAADATVAGSPYAITAAAAEGTGLGNYAITYDTGSFDVTPAPLTITPEDQSKTYGELFTFDGTEFVATGLLFSDAVTSLSLTSAGAAADAPVAGSPYAITGSAAEGTGLGNYAITYDTGSLDVTPAPLTITPDDQSKTYGELFTFDGTEFVATGLLFSDAVTSLSLTSAGAAADATVAGSPYAITGSAAEGTGLNNYTITYNTGSLDVTPAPLTITPDDQSKTYGELFTFDGTEFVATGLLFSDAVTSLALTSAGAAADASVAGSPYAITGSAAEGTGLGNYAITYDTGALDVTPAPLTITPDDQSKTYGELFTFDGTEFVATGLLFSDAVTSLSLTSAGAAADAPVAGSPYTITGAGAAGTGLNNYTITYDTGSFDVTPAPLTITPDDQSKTYGELFTFDGTEFVATGLLFSDAVTSLSLTSAGAAADASVAGSPYAITAAAAEGTGLGNYAITYDTGSFDVTPAPLTITPEDQSKTYGELFTFDGTEFVATGLLFSDAVTSLALTSAGAAADAAVAGSPYAITAAAAEGTGLGNYAITYDTGSFDVTPAPLTITPDDQSKTYGELFTFDGTEFVATGLLFSDAVTSLALTSAGAAADASVAGSPYAITGSAAEGSGLGNYAITYDTGSFDVTPAPLTITPDDQSKTYGELFTFDGTEFVATGLRLSDTVVSVDLASAGAAADAPVAGSPYAITGAGAAGTGLNNYTITYNTGDLDVAPAPLTITPDNISKVFGELYVFDGTEFTATGLLFSDVVTSLTLTSAGAAADAPVAGSPYAITASNPVGTGLGNYVITLNPPAAGGGLTVTPPTPAQDVPTPEPDIGAPPNPADELGLILAGFGTEEAARTLNAVLGFAATLEVAADACSQNLADTDRYLACLSDALDDFANELDAISTQLPPGMEDVAQIVRTARVRTDAARARAASRLAGATTDAERSAIRRDALNEARAAVGTAASEIRKAISFARAEDPELAALQTATVTTVAAAVDSVGIKLSRAVGL